MGPHCIGKPSPAALLWTCSNCPTWTLNCTAPPLPRRMFRLVHYEACTVGKCTVCILLKCFLSFILIMALPSSRARCFFSFKESFCQFNLFRFHFLPTFLYYFLVSYVFMNAECVLLVRGSFPSILFLTRVRVKLPSFKPHVLW